MMMISFVSCKDKTNPKENFEKYLEAWQKKDYNLMYSILDEKSKGNISKTDFAKKYKEIYEEISVDDITAKANYPEEFKKDDNGIISVSFSAKINTLAGETNLKKDVQFTQEENSEGEKEWKLSWDYDMILPDYKEDYILKIENSYGVRGEIYDRNDQPLAVNGENGNRSYPAGSAAGYITGFVGEITEENLSEDKYKDYKKGDIIGLAGLEYQLEDKLKQKTGKIIYYTDKNNEVVKSIAEKSAENGETLKLTIDLDI
jgi:hypothetical protein